jgi:hypothetical protein
VVHAGHFCVSGKGIVFIWAIPCFVSYSTATEMEKRSLRPFYPDIWSFFSRPLFLILLGYFDINSAFVCG